MGDEDDMKVGETGGHWQAQIAKVASVLAAPPVAETYEVGIRE